MQKKICIKQMLCKILQFCSYSTVRIWRYTYICMLMWVCWQGLDWEGRGCLANFASFIAKLGYQLWLMLVPETVRHTGASSPERKKTCVENSESSSTSVIDIVYHFLCSNLVLGKQNSPFCHIRHFTTLRQTGKKKDTCKHRSTKDLSNENVIPSWCN